MKRSKRLQAVVDLAERKSEQGLQAVAYMQKRIAEEEDKLGQLQACRDEYRFSVTGSKTSFNAYSLKSYADFTGNLELAMRQQAGQIEAVKGQLMQVKAHWQQLDAKHKNLVKTQVKIAAQEQKIEALAEQKQQDEYVIQAFSRARADN
ncbi:MAG: flagellar export protein FliJ [Pseudohongiellaceae bacterium]